MHFSKYEGFLLRKQWKFESASECCVSGSPVVAFFWLCNLPSEGQNWISYSVGEVQMQMLGFNITLSLV